MGSRKRTPSHNNILPEFSISRGSIFTFEATLPFWLTPPPSSASEAAHNTKKEKLCDDTTRLDSTTLTMTVSFTWPPPKDGNKQVDEDHSSSMNDSFTWPPPNHQKNGGAAAGSSSLLDSPQKNLRKSCPNIGNDNILSGEVDCPRMQLFDSKAEITYLDDEDDLAARMYSNRPANTPKRVQKEGVSGYDFGNLLKDQKKEYDPWGTRKSCRF